MSEELLKSICSELVAIRELLASRPASSQTSRSTSGQQEGEPPQPTLLIDDPGSVQVHFGKNNGVALEKLTERSLAFYASVKEPRLDSSGKAFPPRPVDVKLENAARQLYHQNKGTLTGPGLQREAAASAPPPQRNDPRPAAQQNLDEDSIPF